MPSLKSRRQIFSHALGLCAGLALAGSLSVAASAATALKIGASGGLNTSIQPLLYAKSAGLFAKNGLEVSIVEMTDDTTAVQSLIAGEFDMLYTGAGTGMTAIGRGANIRLVSSFTPWADYQFLAQPDIKSLKDMEGKVLGVSKIGAISYLAPVFAMQKEGVDTKKVQYMAVGNDAVRGRALAANTIAGAVLNGVNAMIALEAAPQLHIIYDVGSAFRDTAANTAVFARNEAITGKTEAIAAAVKTLMEASRALQSDKKVAVEQATKTGLPVKAVQGTYDLLFNAPQPYYGVDGGVSEQAINSTAKLLKDNGDLDKVLTYKDIVEPKFVEAAMKALGPFKR